MTPMYLKTKQMAEMIGYSPDFLLNNRDLLFFEGEHYFTKNRRINWKVSKVIDWVENREVSSKALQMLERISS